MKLCSSLFSNLLSTFPRVWFLPITLQQQPPQTRLCFRWKAVPHRCWTPSTCRRLQWLNELIWAPVLMWPCPFTVWLQLLSAHLLSGSPEHPGWCRLTLTLTTPPPHTHTPLSHPPSHYHPIPGSMVAKLWLSAPSIPLSSETTCMWLFLWNISKGRNNYCSAAASGNGQFQCALAVVKPSHSRWCRFLKRNERFMTISAHSQWSVT